MLLLKFNGLLINAFCFPFRFNLIVGKMILIIINLIPSFLFFMIVIVVVVFVFFSMCMRMFMCICNLFHPTPVDGITLT